jgi:NADH-quinone oxidoreductase subunit G
VRLVLGTVPVGGEDDRYPKDRKGQPPAPEQTKFTIRAEKCPNRRGVEEVLRHFQGEVIDFDELLRWADAGKLQAVYLAAGYPPPRPSPLGGEGKGEAAWISNDQAGRLKQAALVVLHDLLPSPATDVAHYVLPAASFAEKDGTFVNHAGLAQAIHRAVRPPGEVRTDGQVFLDLLERRGLIHAPSLRGELAKEVAYFAELPAELGEFGVRLSKKGPTAKSEAGPQGTGLGGGGGAA